MAKIYRAVSHVDGYNGMPQLEIKDTWRRGAFTQSRGRRVAWHYTFEATCAKSRAGASTSRWGS